MSTEIFIQNSNGLFLRTTAPVDESKLDSGTVCYYSKAAFKMALAKGFTDVCQRLLNSITNASDEDDLLYYGNSDLKVFTVVDGQFHWVEHEDGALRAHDVKGISTEFAVNSYYEIPVKYIINKSGYFLMTSLQLDESKLADAQVFNTLEALEAADSEAEDVFIPSIKNIEGVLYIQDLNSCFGEITDLELSVEDIINDYMV